RALDRAAPGRARPRQRRADEPPGNRGGELAVALPRQRADGRIRGPPPTAHRVVIATNALSMNRCRRLSANPWPSCGSALKSSSPHENWCEPVANTVAPDAAT